MTRGWARRSLVASGNWLTLLPGQGQRAWRYSEAGMLWGSHDLEGSW
jgi:hypothetical protein